MAKYICNPQIAIRPIRKKMCWAVWQTTHIPKSARGLSTSCIQYKHSLSKEQPSTADQRHVENLRPLAAVPGPRGLPVVGSTLNVLLGNLQSQGQFHEYLSKQHKKYGSIFRQRFFGMNVVIITDPDGIKEVFRQEPQYPVRTEVPPWKYYRESRNITGVFISDGEEWHKHRTALNRHMLRPRNVAAYTRDLNEVLDDLFHRIDDGRQPDGQVMVLQELLFQWSLESVSYVLFEKRLGALTVSPPEEVKNFISAVHDIFTTTQVIAMAPLKLLTLFNPRVWRQFLEASDTVYNIGLKYINARIELVQQKLKLAEGENLPGLTAHLVDGKTLTTRDIYSSLMDLMGAAVDTTSNTALWSLYLLAKNPKKQERLQNELHNIMPPDGIPNEDTVREMHYVKAIIRETLRIYPVVPFLARMVQDDLVIKGYNIPKGTSLMINNWHMSRDPSLFADPDIFKPERWLRADAESESIDPFSSLPFGVGVRSCIGRRLVELELQLLITRIVHQYDIGLVDPQHEVKADYKMLLIPKESLRLTLTPRKAN